MGELKVLPYWWNMTAKRMMTDCVGEFEDFVEILDKDLPEYVEVDPLTIKPKVTTPRPSSLFDDDEDCWFNIDDHWGGMPKYEHKDLKAKRTIVVNFSCEEDVKKFADLLSVNITNKTPSIWYPPRGQIQSTLLQWIDGDLEEHDE